LQRKVAEAHEAQQDFRYFLAEPPRGPSISLMHPVQLDDGKIVFVKRRRASVRRRGYRGRGVAGQKQREQGRKESNEDNHTTQNEQRGNGPEAKALFAQKGKRRRTRPVYVLAPKNVNNLEEAKKVHGITLAQDKNPQ